MTDLKITARMSRAMVVPRRLAALVGEAVNHGLRPTLVGVSKAARNLTLILAALMGLAPTTVLALPCGVEDDLAPVMTQSGPEEVAKWLVQTMPISGFATADTSISGADERHYLLGEAEPSTNDGDDAWIMQMYGLIASHELEDAIDLLYDNVDDLLLAGKMQECDAVLRTLDLSRLESHLMVGLLSITLVASDHLPHRKTLVVAIEEHFMATEPENVEALMGGLR